MRKSKKWFENFPKDKLKEICERFSITPENFYRAAVIDKDTGAVYLNYLKCDRPIPKEWNEYYSWLEKNINNKDLKFYEDEHTTEEIVNMIANLYSSFLEKEVKLKKFQDTAYIRARTIEICNTFRKYFSIYDIQDIDVKKYIAKNVIAHLKMYLEEINILYKKSI